jgi:hypothetical protein
LRRAVDVNRWDEKAGLRTECCTLPSYRRARSAKDVSTVAAKPSKKMSQQKLTVGLDLGDRNSWYCVLDESGADTTGAASSHECESIARSLQRDAAQADRAGNRDAFALDQSLAQRSWLTPRVNAQRHGGGKTSGHTLRSSMVCPESSSRHPRGRCRLRPSKLRVT